MIRILVNGAQGKMGQETVQAVQTDPELVLVAQAGHHDDLAALIRSSQAQVVVDFTTAAQVFETANIIIESGVHPVIGTSGLRPEQIRKLQEKCAEKKLGGIIAPNFSIGAVLMMRYAKEIAHYYDHAEIIEMHHDGKLDAPSGTAIKTAEMIENIKKPKAVHETISGSRGALCHHIPIHAIRLPGIVAAQEVLFGGNAETLSIRHQSIHRSSFMPGVILACKTVISLKEMVYGLEHLL